MGLFDNLKGKFKKVEPMVCVYAGPEYFEKKLKSQMTKVYAGPPAPEKEKTDASIECVYAGPEEPENVDIEDVYNGPEPDPEPVETGDAGTTDPEADYPNNHAVLDEKDIKRKEKIESLVKDGKVKLDDLGRPIPDESMMAVYAGPGYFDPNRLQNKEGPIMAVYAGPAQMMMAYAGPNYTPNNPYGFANIPGFNINKTAPAEWFCDKCGAGNTGKFCKECGSPRPEPSKESWICGCGTKNTGKFCSECGAKRPDAVTPAEPAEWTCSCCGYRNTGKFCVNCGSPRSTNNISENRLV